MTNIMAWVKNVGTEKHPYGQLALPFPKSGTFDPREGRIGVVMADGLASDGREVTRGNQKIFSIGKNYLLGTGSGAQIIFIAKELEPHGDLPPYRLGEKLVKLSSQYLHFQPREQLNFIIAGPTEKGLELYHLQLRHIKKPILSPYPFLCDGSGAQFVTKALHRDSSRGFRSVSLYTSIGDIASYLFDLGYVATRSAGVNDEFQFGFITPKGNATLYHPNVNIVLPTKEYTDAQGNFNQDKAGKNEVFFQEFYRQLRESYHLGQQYNVLMATLSGGDPFVEKSRIFIHAEEICQGLAQCRGELNGMILEYVNYHNR